MMRIVNLLAGTALMLVAQAGAAQTAPVDQTGSDPAAAGQQAATETAAISS